MGRTLLVQGGHLLTMDPALGDLANADVLVEGDHIAAVGPCLGADADEVIDATGKIVIPGFVDTHRHTWETAVRGVAPDATLENYFSQILDTIAPRYRAEDVYAANLAGALECVNAGITTLVDWSHINNTPDHPDAAVTALREVGIRARYAYGHANLSFADYRVDSRIAMPADDIRRIRDTYFSSDDGLLTMGLATRGPGFCRDEVVRAEWRLARELGLPMTVHTAMGRRAGRFGLVTRLHELDLLGPDTTYVHACHLTPHEWVLVADSGGMISVAPQVEAQMGHGWPPVRTALAHGLAPALSADVVTTVPGDMFTQMRAAFALERARVHADAWDLDEVVPAGVLTARQLLTMATVNGAAVAGLADRTGSLTPGKQADLVVIDATAVNLAPLVDPVAAVVLGADVSNVEAVVIAGVVHKRDGRLVTDFARARRLVEAARDHLLRPHPHPGLKEAAQ
jgi:cytosine/adenosine deaminase-related metal-dependent hydrolase